MGKKTILLLMVGVLGACYLYTPLPDNIDEPWTVNCQWAVIKILTDLLAFAELLGISCSLNAMAFLLSFLEVPATSDENVTVMETAFNNVLVYLHFFYDRLSRRTADRLDAVVISTNYRSVPKYHFPIEFEDVYNSLKWFLCQDVLDKYGVDPKRIGISGDSAGENLAAAVTQQLIDDPDVEIKLKIQSLIYPPLQPLDMDLPSYRENSYFPFLPRYLMVRAWSEYFTTDRSLEKAMLLNQHVPVEASHLLKFVNWSSLLPEKFKKGHFYNGPTNGTSELAKKYPGFLDVRAAPLLADDNKLRSLPLTYVLTCQHDILRDDGIMYVVRLQNAGVRVTHNHVEDGFHGAFLYHGLEILSRIENQYMSWLSENL